VTIKDSGRVRGGQGGVVTVHVYLDDGRVYSYEVANELKAREHAAAIVSGGYRHNDGAGEFEHYPPHRVSKVKVTGVVSTNYPDKGGGT
jgi:hypothetical protein